MDLVSQPKQSYVMSEIDPISKLDLLQLTRGRLEAMNILNTKNSLKWLENASWSCIWESSQLASSVSDVRQQQSYNAVMYNNLMWFATQ
jgi:hypothetical protein